MSKQKRKITKAVIAAAGTGTRFLPATKNQPKEMLPVIDKPIIHYLVEEAVNSGIEDIILVTRAGNHIMEDYFDNRSELENMLERAGKLDKLEMIRDIPKMANFIYVRQKSHLPYGNGTPLLSAQNLIDDDESFVFMWGDDMTISTNGKTVTQQLIDVYHEYEPTVVQAVQEVPLEEVKKYGVIEYKTDGKNEYEVKRVVEKPNPEDAPSNKVQYGRFVFSYDIIRKAQETVTGKGGELWVTDMIDSLIKDGKTVLAPPVAGVWLTTGDPLQYLKTSMKFAMQRIDLRDELIAFLIAELQNKSN